MTSDIDDWKTLHDWNFETFTFRKTPTVLSVVGIRWQQIGHFTEKLKAEWGLEYTGYCLTLISSVGKQVIVFERRANALCDMASDYCQTGIEVSVDLLDTRRTAAASEQWACEVYWLWPHRGIYGWFLLVASESFYSRPCIESMWRVRWRTELNVQDVDCLEACS